MGTRVANKTHIRRSSEKERKGNALAPGAEEGRGKLRKASGSCKQAEIRGYPNGETHMVNSHVLLPESNRVMEGTR